MSNTQKKCFKLISVDKETHLRHRKYLSDMVEHGGNFVLNIHDAKLYDGTETTGKYNQIDMIRGIIDFHTHPRQCLNDNTCAVGVPSPADITNIVLGAIYGTVGHLVYSREGTYLIQVSDEIMDLVRCDHKMLEKITKLYEKASDDLHAEFMKHKFNYGKYTQKWCRLMRKLGLKVKLYKLNKVPRFMIPYQCILDKQNNGTYDPEIKVPTDIAHEMEKRCNIK